MFHWCLLRNSTWEPSEAVGTLIGYVAADPGDRQSRLALAENYLRMDRADDAESVLAPLPDTDSDALELRTRIALERQDLDAADRLVASAAANDPLIARLRGRMALARGDIPAAARDFRISYTHDPESRETLFGLAAALELSGDSPAPPPCARWPAASISSPP